MKVSAIASTAVWATLLPAPAAMAVERSPFEDRLRLTMGAWSAATATDLRADAGNGAPGTLVSGEDDFGLRARSEMADVELELRLRPRHKLRLNYFQLDRRASTQLDRQFDFGDQTYFVDDLADSQLDLSNFSTTFSWMFLRRERFELGFTLGLHLYQFEGEVAVPARLIEERESEAGPVLLPGLEASVRLGRRWHAEARIEYLDVTVEQVQADFRNRRAAVFYRFNDNVAVGAGYVSFDSLVILDDPGESGRWKFSNSGGELLFRVGF
jgi:hypothetical protein